MATAFESGLYTGMILIDSQKAFDTVNHDVLLLDYYYGVYRIL